MSATTVIEGPQGAALDRSQIRAEIARILEHPSFRQSERCSKLLRFLAESFLTKNVSPLKERTIGHEVFGRDANYDTYYDPVVRNAASEVRRRLREYYHEVPDSRVRVEFPNGRYHLHLIVTDSKEATHPMEELSAGPMVALPAESAPEEKPKGRRHLWGYIAVAVLTAMAMLGLYLAVQSFRVAPRNAFWDPVLSSRNPIVVALGVQKQKGEAEVVPPYAVRLAASTAYAETSGFLQNYGAKFLMKPDVDTTLEDVRNSTTIVIGGMGNVWINRLEQSVRYRCGIDDQGRPYLQDTISPNNRWTEVAGISYATVSRFASPITGGVVIILDGGAGLGAAGEFVTYDRYRNTLNGIFSRSKGNMQIVLRAPIIGGQSGSPEVVTTYTW